MILTILCKNLNLQVECPTNEIGSNKKDWHGQWMLVAGAANLVAPILHSVILR